MRVVTLKGNGSFMKEREKQMANGALAPPIFTTSETFSELEKDKRVFITMDVFMKKKREGDFGHIIDADGVLLGVSNYLFID